jgi:hypothetical protein
MHAVHRAVVQCAKRTFRRVVPVTRRVLVWVAVVVVSMELDDCFRLWYVAVDFRAPALARSSEPQIFPVRVS